MPELPAVRELVNALPGGVVSFAHVLRAGLVAVLALQLPGPSIGGPSQDTLMNAEAYRLAAALVQRCLEAFGRERPGEARTLAARLLASHIDPKTGTV